MRHHFEKLRSAYAITIGGSLLPGAGGYSLGAITVAIAGESNARAWIEQMAGVLASLGQGSAGVLPVGDPWKFMRRAAGEGIAGIQLMDDDGGAVGFMFMVRVEEAGAALPTVLTSITVNGWDTCLTRRRAALDARRRPALAAFRHSGPSQRDVGPALPFSPLGSRRSAI